MNNPGSIPLQLVDHLFRHEAGKMIAVLTRIFGIQHLATVEDVVQEAFLKAMQVWPIHQVPDNPSGWLMQVARNKAIDIIRRQQNFHLFSQEVARQLHEQNENIVDQFFLDSEINDSQLRMIFTCCHPDLREEDQVALTLKTVSGFGIQEIARALFAHETAVQKRLYRAKQLIKERHLVLEIPAGNQLGKRLETVHTVIYLLFNEGYNSLRGDELIRKDLCAEAMRLCLLLAEHPAGKNPATFALLSLMCFQASRFNTRMDETNSIILLQFQDRTKWDQELIARGYQYLTLSSQGDTISTYHIESAIAAEHCLCKSFDQTNWKRMLDLYDLLLNQKRTPTVILNRAIVLAHLSRVSEAIDEINRIENIADLLETQYIFNAVLGDLYIKLQNMIVARKYLLQARELTFSRAEKKLISSKINTLDEISKM